MSASTTVSGVRQADALAKIDESALRAYYPRVAGLGLVPAWLLYKGLFPPYPTPATLPAHWSYEKVSPCLNEAGRLISPEHAERRVLMFENPGLPGQGQITGTMSGALQLILPGERAPAHRHAAAAFRFVLEGHGGAVTTVEGQQVQMFPGDLVVTPSWAWHDHISASDTSAVWFDGLDVYLVNFLCANFFEIHAERQQPVDRSAVISGADFSHNLLPVEHEHDRQLSPIRSYPYARSREALDVLSRTSRPDPWHGFRMKYANPLSGGWVMPTIATTIQFLPRGYHTAPYRSTEAAVFIVVEGQGESKIADSRFAWREHDVLVVPNWAFHEIRADTDAVLFSYSERAALESLGLFREEKCKPT